MATQLAKAKWQPPHLRRVATHSTITTAPEQVKEQVLTVTTKHFNEQVKVQVKKSSWTPPHLRKAQDLPVTPAAKSDRSTLDPSSPAYKSAEFVNSLLSSLRSVTPPLTENVSPAIVKSVSPVSAKSDASSNPTNTRKTLLGMGLDGSRWAPKVPTAEQIAKAESPETRLKATADLLAFCLVMETQQELVDKRKKEALENGGEGFRYSSDYTKVREENQQQMIELSDKIVAANLAAAHSLASTDQSQLILSQRPSPPANATAKVVPAVKESAQVQDHSIIEHFVEVQSSAKAVPTVKEPVHLQVQVYPLIDPSVGVQSPAKATSNTNESEKVQDHPVVYKSVEIQASAKAASCAKEFQQVQNHPVVRQLFEVQSTVKDALNTGAVEKSVSSTAVASRAPTVANPPGGLATNFSLWSSSVTLLPSSPPTPSLPPSFTHTNPCSPNRLFTLFISSSKSQKPSGISVTRPKTVASTAPAKSSSTLSISGSTGGSRKDDEQSKAAHSTGPHSDVDQSTNLPSIAAQSIAPGLTAGTTASDCSQSPAEDIAIATTTEMLLPASITPNRPQIATPVLSESIIVAPASAGQIPFPYSQHIAAPAVIKPAAPETVAAPMAKAPESTAAPNPNAAAPVKLATTLEGFTNFRPAARAPPPVTNNMSRRNGWLTKEETKAMRSRPLDDCLIDEDAYEGEIQNNDWPSADENSPDLCLRQWDGDWLPAPVDWAARNQYKRADKFAEDIATWVNRTNNHYLVIQSGKSKVTFNLMDANGNIITSEIVPHAWVPEKIEGKSLQEFWNCLLQSKPEPLEAEDVRFAPFWQRYLTQNHNSDEKEVTAFQESLPGPEPKLDVADCGVILYQKGKNQTAATISTQIAKKNLKDAAKKEAIREKHTRSMKKDAKRPVIASPPNPHKPAENIYLRPATNRDDAQMAHIYNHYVNTHFSNAMTPLTAGDMQTKLRGVAAANLSMIVAVSKVKRTGGQHPNLQSTQERIVGFACLDEHEGAHGLFRYAADLDVFVHPEYAHKGVGKSLVDRLMYMADSHYQSREAVEWRPMSDDPYLTSPGGKRNLGTVYINAFYPSDEKARLVWIKTWLQQFGFALCAKMPGGIKLEKNVTRACFVYNTGPGINPISART